VTVEYKKARQLWREQEAGNGETGSQEEIKNLQSEIASFQNRKETVSEELTKESKQQEWLKQQIVQQQETYQRTEARLKKQQEQFEKRRQQDYGNEEIPQEWNSFLHKLKNDSVTDPAKEMEDCLKQLEKQLGSMIQKKEQEMEVIDKIIYDPSK